MRPDLAPCAATGIDAWLLGLLAALALASVPFLYGLARRRTALGCGLSVLLFAATPAIWLVEPLSASVPARWLACGSSARVFVLAGLAPATALLIGVLLCALIWLLSRRRQPPNAVSTPSPRQFVSSKK